MRIASTGRPDVPATSQTVNVSNAEDVVPSVAPASAAGLQSAQLQPALAALRDIPDMDHAKIASLRDALAKGEIPFNASRLANLIERYHGGR